MKASKVILIILGVLLIIGGIYCFCAPVATFASLTWVIGLVMIVDAIGDICTWSRRRKIGETDGWSLAGFIISLILGILLICNVFAQFFAVGIITYLFIFWMIAVGIIRIATAIKVKNAKNIISAQVGAQTMFGKGWGFILAMGIIMLIVGIFALFNPGGAVVAIGWMIGFGIIAAGISTISVAMSLK